MRGILKNEKLVSVENLSRVRASLDGRGKKLVLTNGCFDILHSGHNYMLKAAAKLGDALAVIINSDSAVRLLKGADRPIFSQEERAFNLSCLEAVDYVCIVDSPRLAAEIAEIAPHVYAKGGDYAMCSIDAAERAALEKCGAKIRFVPFADGFSTTGVIGRVRASAERAAL